MNTDNTFFTLLNKLSLILLLTTSLNGCETLKVSKPIVPMKEYEIMLIGRIDANYVGNETCLTMCHYHDKIKQDFEASTMGAQLSANSGMPLVDCESCHGPGSLAIRGITRELLEEDAKLGKKTACNFDTLIQLGNLPAPVQSLLCLKCHTANATFNLHNWNSGAHAGADVSCFPCHNVHMGSDLIVGPKDTTKMCEQCHQRIKAEFSLPSHHPIMEERISCSDCHNAHGSLTDSMLKEDSVKETCTRCHGEKEGPFIYEHADNTEDCTVCHNSHGSMNNMLLKLREPFLCMQCHAGHRTSDSVTTEAKTFMYARCTNCHSQIHGSDLPAAGGNGRFTH